LHDEIAVLNVMIKAIIDELVPRTRCIKFHWI
jgi:hypothetical protein